MAGQALQDRDIPVTVVLGFALTVIQIVPLRGTIKILKPNASVVTSDR
jgi:hypothetical protein